jgi:hypothetical protein
MNQRFLRSLACVLVSAAAFAAQPSLSARAAPVRDPAPTNVDWNLEIFVPGTGVKMAQQVFDVSMAQSKYRGEPAAILRMGVRQTDFRTPFTLGATPKVSCNGKIYSNNNAYYSYCTIENEISIPIEQWFKLGGKIDASGGVDLDILKRIPAPKKVKQVIGKLLPFQVNGRIEGYLKIKADTPDKFTFVTRHIFKLQGTGLDGGAMNFSIYCAPRCGQYAYPPEALRISLASPDVQFAGGSGEPEDDAEYLGEFDPDSAPEDDAPQVSEWDIFLLSNNPNASEVGRIVDCAASNEIDLADYVSDESSEFFDDPFGERYTLVGESPRFGSIGFNGSKMIYTGRGEPGSEYLDYKIEDDLGRSATGKISLTVQCAQPPPPPRKETQLVEVVVDYTFTATCFSTDHGSCGTYYPLGTSGQPSSQVFRMQLALPLIERDIPVEDRQGCGESAIPGRWSLPVYGIGRSGRTFELVDQNGTRVTGVQTESSYEAYSIYGTLGSRDCGRGDRLLMTKQENQSYRVAVVNP